MDDCVNQQVSQHYSKWLSHCEGLVRDKKKAGDLLHEVLTQILDRDRDSLVRLACSDSFYYYVSRALWLSYYSKTSKYHKQHRKFERMCVTDNIDTNNQDQTFDGSRLDNEYIDGYLLRINEHDATLIRLWMLPDFSYDRLSIETGIDKKYLYNSLHAAIKRLRKHAVKL